MTVKRPFAEAMDPAKAAAQLAQDQGYDQEYSRILQAMVMLQNKPK